MSKPSLLSFKGFMRQLDKAISTWPDPRRGKSRRYSMRDTELGAFAVFFMQCASFLTFQQLMLDSLRKSNAQILFGMEAIPCDNQIRTLLDPVDPSSLFEVFEVFDAVRLTPWTRPRCLRCLRCLILCGSS